MEDLLAWLQKTYFEDFCNGSWEHEHGITVDTIDNPGWDFRFELKDTDLEEIVFDTGLIQKSETDWYRCFIRDGIFHGWGGPLNFSDILSVFKEWYTTTVARIDGVTKE